MSHEMNAPRTATTAPGADETGTRHSSASEAAERTAAIALWVVVGAALLYGVTETGVRVAALFA